MLGRGLRPRGIRWRALFKANKENSRRKIRVMQSCMIYDENIPFLGAFLPDFCRIFAEFYGFVRLNCSFGRGMEWA